MSALTYRDRPLDEDQPTVRLTSENVKRIAASYPLPIRHALALATGLEKGRLQIAMPDGARFAIVGDAPGPCAEICIDDLAFARKLAGGAEIGFADAFVDGDWRSPDLVQFLELFCLNRDVLARLLQDKPMLRFIQMLTHRLRPNTRGGARRNIHAHYDIGNAFYEAWLDETMTYSAAMFEDHNESLAVAQERKYRAMAEAAALRQDMNVLEIGCGWGGFASFAAKEFGCRVTGLTISREQFDFASRRVFEAGLAERVQIQLRDYRDETGLYDGVVSIEMVEAVGEAYWPLWFRSLRDRLCVGGRAAVQAITIDEQVFPIYRRELDFIRRYIFPGGMLPTGEILRSLGAKAGLAVVAERRFGPDYGRTLAQWRTRFRTAWPNLSTLGFDERFRRLWEYYLAYCEAGFRAGAIDVRQLAFTKEA